MLQCNATASEKRIFDVSHAQPAERTSHFEWEIDKQVGDRA